MISEQYQHLVITFKDSEGNIEDIAPVADIFDNDDELLNYAYIVNNGEDLVVTFQ